MQCDVEGIETFAIGLHGAVGGDGREFLAGFDIPFASLVTPDFDPEGIDMPRREFLKGLFGDELAGVLHVAGGWLERDDAKAAQWIVGPAFGFVALGQRLGEELADLLRGSAVNDGKVGESRIGRDECPVLGVLRLKLDQHFGGTAGTSVRKAWGVR